MQVTHRIPVPGAELAVALQRHATSTLAPVVLLHAGVCDRRMWAGAFEALGAERTVLAIDRRGFGLARVAQAQPHSPVDDLVAVLDALALGPVELLGCSLGGRISIDLALAQPARVAGLTLVAPAVSGAPRAALDEASQVLSDAIEAVRGDAERTNPLQARLWLDGPGQPDGRVGGAARELFLDMNGMALRADPGAWIELPSAWERLEQITAPTRLIWGELDLPMLRERCEQMSRRLPGVVSLRMPGVAHLPSLEAPAAFNQALRSVGLLGA